jgi:hypothetical protein
MKKTRLINSKIGVLFRSCSQQQTEEAAKQRLVVLFMPRFDNWVMKPIDFKKLKLVLPRVKSPELRRELL